MRGRGVIRLSTLRSPRRSTRLTMLRSSLSMTPCSALSETSRRISSSLTRSLLARSTPSRRRIMRVIQISTKANGVASAVIMRIGMAVATANFSGLTRARRFGSSSPNSMLAKVMPDTLRATPIGTAYWASNGTPRRSSKWAMSSPILAPSAVPVPMPISVMNTCTVDRKRSGVCASDSAICARRLVTAICFRRNLRDVIKAISLSAKKPLRKARKTTRTTVKVIQA